MLSTLGDYNVQQRLGSGAFSEVYRVVHRMLPRLIRVAKVLKTRENLGPLIQKPTEYDEILHRFYNEAHTLSLCHHDNVVACHHFGTADTGQPYIILEACRQSLEQAFSEPDARHPLSAIDGRLDLDTTLDIAHDLLRGLAYLHRKGIVHRDLKPSNVLLRDHETTTRWVLSDFGLADTSERLYSVHNLNTMGTAYYIAPELLHGDRSRATATSDLFSLGVILYRCLSGRIPTVGSPHIRESRIDIPEHIATTLMSLLGEVSTRPQSAETVLSAFGLDERRVRKRPRKRLVLGPPTALDHPAEVSAVAFSPTQPLLATACYDRMIRFFEQGKREPARELFGHSRYIHQIAFSPDGTLLATASSDATVRVWEVETGDYLFSLAGHDGEIYSVAFSPSGDLLASAAKDGSVRLWNARVGTLVREQRGLEADPEPLFSVAISPDGDWLTAAQGAHALRLWRTDEEGELLDVFLGHDHPVFDVAFSPDGQRLVSCAGDHQIRLWAPWSGELEHTFSAHGHWSHISVQMPSNGQLRAESRDDRTMMLRSPTTDALLGTIEGFEHRVHSIAFNRDGNLLASSCQETTLRLWSIP